MSALQHTPLRIPDVITGAWFRQFVIEVLAKADIRNAIGYGITITSDGDSVATISADAETAGAISGHNLDPLAHVEAFAAHVSQPDPHPAYAMHREADDMAFFLGE
jgi:hypothetical protein